MNKHYLALSLILASGLHAAEGRGNQNTNRQTDNCQACCSHSCSCTPCCVPEPKPCVNCVCYNPPFYDLQCDCGLFLDAEFLYWYARETNMSYGLKIRGTLKNTNNALSDVTFSPKKYLNITSQWSPGVRAGIGWNDNCDGWDYYLSWTFMPNRKSNRFAVNRNYALNNTQIFAPGPGQDAILDPFVNPAVFPLTTADTAAIITFDTAHARWKLNLNYADFEIGRKYWTSPCFTMRPFAAVRGIWVEKNLKLEFSRTSPQIPTETSLVFQDRFKDHQWGVGMVGGLQPAWSLCQGLVLFSKIDVALVWGQFKVQKKENYQDPQALTGSVIAYTNTSTNNFFQMTPILDLDLGIRWEETWCQQYYSAFEIGWEHHIFLDQNHRSKVVDRVRGPGTTFEQGQSFGFRNFLEETGNLDFGGLVVRARVAF